MKLLKRAVILDTASHSVCMLILSSNLILPQFFCSLIYCLIHVSQDSPLVLQSDRNVTVNARNHMGQLTGQLTVGECSLLTVMFINLALLIVSFIIITYKILLKSQEKESNHHAQKPLHTMDHKSMIQR